VCGFVCWSHFDCAWIPLPCNASPSGSSPDVANDVPDDYVRHNSPSVISGVYGELGIARKLIQDMLGEGYSHVQD
jgi:hypothetical protein